jgi:DNA-binding NarL/FixJ family response regulator
VRRPTASAGDAVLRLAAPDKVAGSTGQPGIVRPHRDPPAGGRGSPRLAYASVGRGRAEARDRAAASQASRQPTPEETELLELLEQGMKDRAIARALGIGERTVQRRLSRLMSALGAKTRFQAAINAVRRGWL